MLNKAWNVIAHDNTTTHCLHTGRQVITHKYSRCPTLSGIGRLRKAPVFIQAKIEHQLIKGQGRND